MKSRWIGRQRGGAVLVLVAVLLCALITVVFRRAQPPRLMDRATRLAPWPIEDQAFPLPGRALLRLHQRVDLEHVQAFRLDAHTGAETALSDLNAALAKHDGDNWQVSPDGRTLLFRSFDFGDGGIAYGVCGLDGTGLVEMPRPVIGGDMVWLRDGRSWACLDGGREGRQFHAALRVNRLGSAREQRLILAGTPEAIEKVARQERMLGVLADGRALVLTDAPDREGGVKGRVGLADFAVAPGAAIHAYSVPIPKNLSLDGILLSPLGDRLAWLTGRATPSRWLRPLQLLLLRLGLKTPPSQTEELWVSDLDGGRRHLIGGITLPADASELSLVQWTGDGGALTFQYHKALYAVPAD